MLRIGEHETDEEKTDTSVCPLQVKKDLLFHFITFGNKGNYGDHAGGEKV